MTNRTLYRSGSSAYLMKASYQRNMLIGSSVAGGIFLSFAVLLMILPTSPDTVSILYVDPPPVIVRDTLHNAPTVIPDNTPLPQPGGGRSGSPGDNIQNAGLFVDSVTLVDDSVFIPDEEIAFGGNLPDGSVTGEGSDGGDGDFFGSGPIPYYDTTTTYTFMDSLDRLPQLIHMTKPVYPRLARQIGLEATVLLEILVDADGTVADVRVHSETNPAHDFAENAIKEASKATFSPAIRGNQPVRCWVSLPVIYRMNDK